jgi:ligand-binding sensor protein
MKNLLRINPNEDFVVISRATKDDVYEATTYCNVRDFLDDVGVIDISYKEATDWAARLHYCEIIQSKKQYYAVCEETKNTLAVYKALHDADFLIV